MDLVDVLPNTRIDLSFSQTWGCQMIAFILNLIFYGIGVLLVGQYFKFHSRGDALGTKLVVAILGFLSTVQVGFLSHQVYVDFVQLFGERDQLDVIVFSAPIQLLSVFLVSFIAQIFFASRIWMITRHNILYTVPVVMLAFTQLGAGIAQTFLVFTYGRYSELHFTARVSSTQAGATAACDVVITSILCWVLHDARSTVRKSFDGRVPYQRSHEKTVRTESTINRLMLYAVERGAATSACAMLNLVFFVGMPGTFIFMIFLEPSCPLYLISVVSMLANRSSLRAQLFDELAATAENPEPRQLGDRCTLSMIERARALSSTAHQLPSVHISTSHRSHDQLGIVYDPDAQMVLDAEMDSININGIVVQKHVVQWRETI